MRCAYVRVDEPILSEAFLRAHGYLTRRRPAQLRRRFTSSLLRIAGDLDVRADSADLDVFELDRLVERRGADAADTAERTSAAEQLRREKHGHLVDEPRLEKPGRGFGAAFDDEPVKPAGAEIVEERAEIESAARFGRERDDFDAPRNEIRGRSRRRVAGVDDDRSIAGARDEPARRVGSAASDRRPRARGEPAFGLPPRYVRSGSSATTVSRRRGSRRRRAAAPATPRAPRRR